ncbi:hypothetical protein EC973_003375 [Apophysomyces ossiformis]|uniref:Uncharacterized protein n=1 Tax=Apophysomyces ossiformis TaxID=679940 RepID=A0A8H7EV00_9FUNG|nr:hypothetical protein EC973_003375 [Apophysomyces ossiformis]
MYAFEPITDYNYNYDPYVYRRSSRLKAQAALFPQPSRQPRQRLSRSSSTGHTRRRKYGEDRWARRASYQEEDSYYDEEEELMDQRQREAAENAIRNQVLRFYEDEDVLPVASISSPTNETPTSGDISSSLATPTSVPPQPPSITTAVEGKPRRKWLLSFLFKRPSLTPAPSPSQSLSTSASSQSSSSNTRLKPARETLPPDPTQNLQPKQAQQIDRSIQSTSHAPGVDPKVASLDRFWAFRLQKTGNGPANGSHRLDNVWVAFDYENQQRLKLHEQQLQDKIYAVDVGVELFDSHIQQARLPVLALTSQNLCYYPIDSSGNKIGTLEIMCLQNTSNVEFVPRQHPHYQHHLHQHLSPQL